MTGAMDGRAEDHGRVYQASGDQHISEHHHHGDAAAVPGGPDSVRRPAVGRPPVLLRDRAEVLERLRASVRAGHGGEGRFDEADQEIRRVADAYRRRFGPDYPIALSAQQLLARTRAARGDLDTAIEILTDVVARRERGLGAGHPFTVAGRRLLGDLASGRSRPPGA